MYYKCIMKCAVDTTKVQQDDGSIRGIEIIPEGCQPVSEDLCTSGYMAPAQNVTFPENSFKQCCKCKEGERCALCKDPNACTDDEKEKFMTGENCFGTATSPSPGPSPGPSADVSEEVDTSKYILIGGVTAVVLLLLLIFLLSR
jgi:hypothetical protein